MIDGIPNYFYQKDMIGKHDNWPSIVDRNDFRIEASIDFRDCELTCLPKSRWYEMVNCPLHSSQKENLGLKTLVQPKMGIHPGNR